ncbi:hypothetical protein TNCV_2524301 [Trichonephila clavipes]|nr:hypothetical protein TNCV_2524301 [Trichonephila clavipes]
MPRAHQAGFSRRSLAGVGLSESVQCHGPGLALLTNEGVQQQQDFNGHCILQLFITSKSFSAMLREK